MIAKIFRTCSKITKNHENHNLNEKRQLTDTNTKMNQMLELHDKDLKATKIKMIQQLQIALKQIKNKRENLSKVMEVIKPAKWKLLN